jgi:hypothetical protein
LVNGFDLILEPEADDESDPFEWCRREEITVQQQRFKFVPHGGHGLDIVLQPGFDQCRTTYD